MNPELDESAPNQKQFICTDLQFEVTKLIGASLDERLRPMLSALLLELTENTLVVEKEAEPVNVTHLAANRALISSESQARTELETAIGTIKRLQEENDEFRRAYENGKEEIGELRQEKDLEIAQLKTECKEYDDELENARTTNREYRALLESAGLLTEHSSIMPSEPETEPITIPIEATTEPQPETVALKFWNYSFSPEVGKYIFIERFNGREIAAIMNDNPTHREDVKRFLDERASVIHSAKLKYKTDLQRDEYAEKLYNRWKSVA